MAISPSSSVQRAREQLAERLRDIRLDARLSARALAAAVGWHESKVSRIESATRAPGEDDIRAWCQACNAERAVPDLIAASRAADSMYIEWRKLQLAGMRTTAKLNHRRSGALNAQNPSSEALNRVLKRYRLAAPGDDSRSGPVYRAGGEDVVRRLWLA
ncbi:MAG: helix-turn-helix domain protein [Actinomycetia bacterium]|nr:helix-turn-helix domain protein [Actinomycetes bacterium]